MEVSGISDSRRFNEWLSCFLKEDDGSKKLCFGRSVCENTLQAAGSRIFGHQFYWSGNMYLFLSNFWNFFSTWIWRYNYALYQIIPRLQLWRLCCVSKFISANVYFVWLISPPRCYGFWKLKYLHKNLNQNSEHVSVRITVLVTVEDYYYICRRLVQESRSSPSVRILPLWYYVKVQILRVPWVQKKVPFNPDHKSLPKMVIKKSIIAQNIAHIWHHC